MNDTAIKWAMKMRIKAAMLVQGGGEPSDVASSLGVPVEFVLWAHESVMSDLAPWGFVKRETNKA